LRLFFRPPPSLPPFPSFSFPISSFLTVSRAFGLPRYGTNEHCVKITTSARWMRLFFSFFFHFLFTRPPFPPHPFSLPASLESTRRPPSRGPPRSPAPLDPFGRSMVCTSFPLLPPPFPFFLGVGFGRPPGERLTILKRADSPLSPSTLLGLFACPGGFPREFLGGSVRQR